VSHVDLSAIKANLATLGVSSTILPGAQGRSARQWGAGGYPRGCQAFCSHHSVSSGLFPANDIAFILTGGVGEGYIISNAYTALDGHVTLIASGPTYTEGSGGPLGLIPANGANTVCFSNEIASWGQPNSVYPVPQQFSAVCLAAVVADLAAKQYSWTEPAWHPWRNFAHFEWAPDRKVDPRGISRWSPNGGMWDMDLFRAEIRSILTPPTAPEPPEEFNVFHIIANAQDAAFRMKGFADVVAVVDGVPQPVTHANAAPLFGMTPADLTAVINNPVPTHLETIAWLRAHGVPMSPSTGGV
jgi:hypothetical protein